MLSPYIYAALAHERHQSFLAQAETGRRARQVRLHRRRAGIPGARRSPLRQRLAWLQPEVRADFVRHEPGALRYEIMLGPAEQYRPTGVFRSSDDPPGRLADPGVVRGGPEAEGVGE